ncbi:MAG: hypothetical protein AAFY66_06580, partial [Pseudomonadota bacterium]
DLAETLGSVIAGLDPAVLLVVRGLELRGSLDPQVEPGDDGTERLGQTAGHTPLGDMYRIEMVWSDY